jgi:outer membrane protein, heavy metal efflux system
MRWSGRKSTPVCILLLVATGCSATRPGALLRSAAANSPTIVARETADRDAPPRVSVAFLLAPTDATPVAAAHFQDAPKEALSVDVLAAEVLARNPSLGQMVAAWQAASARYPQARSWDDPMLAGMVAPASFGSNSVEPGYRVEVSQKIPFPGKLRLRGDGALAEANAASNDVNDMRVQLVEAARLAFYDYYQVDRAIAVNDESLRLLNEFKENAVSRYRTGLVPQQDVLQADVEIGRQRERTIVLDRMRKVVVARINTLRNAPTNESLLPPPQQLKIVPGLPSVDKLQSDALAQRPDLKALEDRIKVEQAALALAKRDYYPDTEVMAAYDTIMGNGPMRDLAPQVGVRMNLPIRMSKRNGAVAEANAKVAQKQAELASRMNQVRLQVREAYEQLVESERILVLYGQTILPAARENVKAAQAAYATGKTPFLSLIEAERNLVNLRDRNDEATADYFRRAATLERVIGAPVRLSGELAPSAEENKK